MGQIWGIDLGGTKIEGVVLTGASADRTLCRKRVPTESQRGYRHILGRVAALVEALAGECGANPSTIGFGTPGVHDPKTGLMKNCNTTCLNGQPLQRDLEALLSVPVQLANDANCFALAEARFGAARGANPVFGVIMGTGVGGGVVIDGHAIKGCQGIAGEWGHNVLNGEGPACYCGKRGCVETIISGPALESAYRAASGRDLALTEIHARHVAGGDSAATSVIEGLLENFARAIAVVINILDPEVVVLGGGVSNLPELYRNDTRDRVAKYVFNNRLETRIVKHELGDSAGVFGAAMLVDAIRTP